MQIIQILLRQIIIMFIYMALGYLLFKAKKITKEGSRDLASLLLWVISPSIILKSFCIEFSILKLTELFYSTILAFLALLISTCISKIIYPKSPIDNFASSYPNCGFMGIPLVQATLGNEAVFYMLGILSLLNIFQQTHGVKLMAEAGTGTGTGTKNSNSFFKIISNPLIITPIIGLLIFCLNLGTKVPSIFTTTLDGLGSLNTPIAMILLGTYLAQTDVKSLFVSPILYKLSFTRLLVIPFAIIVVYCLIPINTTIKLAVLIPASAPIGTNTAIYAQLYGSNYTYACKTVALSTLLSIIGLPIVLFTGNYLFSF